MKLIKVSPTDANSKKKYIAEFCECSGKTKCDPNDRKKIYFGQKGSTTFTEGASVEKQQAYIARHKVNENFYKVSPGALSRWILWSSTSLVQGIKNFKKNVGC